MYTISKTLEDGVILTCRDCSHIERVNRFSLVLGSQRTQAAQSMHAHSQDKHCAGPSLKLLPQSYGVIKRYCSVR
jgi:hypothetical protein